MKILILYVDIFLFQDQVQLSNIFENMEIPFPKHDYRPAGNYICIAPETFPNHGGKLYTASSDMYALGE